MASPETTSKWHLLRNTAFDILCARLSEHGNILDDEHRRALSDLLGHMVGYIGSGGNGGRHVYPLFTGGGKTTAVAALAAALNRTGSTEPIAVSASQVEHLCCLYDEMRALGVPEEMIGIKHADTKARIKSKDNNFDGQIQLVTHVRVRMKKDAELFMRHKGRPRNLMVYDESFFRADSIGMDDDMLHDSAAPLLSRLGRGVLKGVLLDCAEYLKEGLSSISATMERTKPGEDGLPVEFPYREPVQIETYEAAVRNSSIFDAPVAGLVDIIRISQEPLLVATTAQGKGLLWTSDAIPAELTNVLVLDASYAVRTLCRMDLTLSELGEGDRLRSMKDWQKVKVTQVETSGSRSALEGLFKDTTRGRLQRSATAFAKEILTIVQQELETAKGILVFTYKQRGRGPDFEKTLRDTLDEAGVDQSKVHTLTWGKETSLNSMAHCDVVILAGIMHRAHIDILAAIKGQQGDLNAPCSHSTIEDVCAGERAHLVLQAASRGTARVTTAGVASPMKVYLFDRNGTVLESRLRPVMRGVQWEYVGPKFMPRVRRDGGSTREMLSRLLDYLQRASPETAKVSSREVKRNLGLDPKNRETESTFRRAGERLPVGCGWAREGRGFARKDAAFYGFAA